MCISTKESKRHGAFDLRAQRDAGRVLRPPRNGRQRRDAPLLDARDGRGGSDALRPPDLRTDGGRMAPSGARSEGDTVEPGLGEEARSQAQVRGLDDAPRLPVEQHASRRRGPDPSGEGVEEGHAARTAGGKPPTFGRASAPGPRGRISLRGPPRGGRTRSVLVFRPTAIIAPEVRGRDTAQIGHRGVALSPALAAKNRYRATALFPAEFERDLIREPAFRMSQNAAYMTVSS